MHTIGWKRLRSAQEGGTQPQGRSAPKDMPREDLPPQSRVPHQTAQPQDVLPTQKPISDEAAPPAPPAKWKKRLKRGFQVFLIVLALSMAYLFLLLGEPENATLEASTQPEESISVPMAALELQAGGDLSTLAATFGKPVLALYGGLELAGATLYDTAFQGAYARRAILTYTLEDGQRLTVESIRPTSASTLLAGKERATLSINQLYALAGVDAVRMDLQGGDICILGQTQDAVYAVRCPATHEAELGAVLKQTLLLQPDLQGE